MRLSHCLTHWDNSLEAAATKSGVGASKEIKATHAFIHQVLGGIIGANTLQVRPVEGENIKSQNRRGRLIVVFRVFRLSTWDTVALGGMQSSTI